MMNKTSKQISILLLLITGFLASCKKEFMNVESPDQIPASQTWSDGPLSEAFVNGCYSKLYTGGFSEQMLASLSDEAVFTHVGRNINTINEGSLSPTNVGWVDATYDLDDMYNGIRACNLAL